MNAFPTTPGQPAIPQPAIPGQPGMTPITTSMTTSMTTPITAARRYPAAPLVGVGVAVFNDAGAVLLVQRGRPPRVGQWSLPGGLIDLGERLTAAAAREVYEECGITVDVGELVGAFEPIYRDAAGQVEYHYVVLDYWARHVAGEAAAHDDAAAVAWVALADLATYAVTPEAHTLIHQAHAAWQRAATSHTAAGSR